jgi:hypothetical protein
VTTLIALLLIVGRYTYIEGTRQRVPVVLPVSVAATAVSGATGARPSDSEVL